MPEVDSNKVTAARIRELLEKQHYRCAMTGWALTPETASLDHIVPLAHGGEHRLSNVWIVAHKVNLAKGTMRYEEFVDMCRAVVDVASGQA